MKMRESVFDFQAAQGKQKGQKERGNKASKQDPAQAASSSTDTNVEQVAKDMESNLNTGS